MDREVTLGEVLAAREARATRQREMLERHGLPLVSFCMNIAGPVKNGPVIRRAFEEGMRRLGDAAQAARMRVVERTWTSEVTGCEALFAVRGDARRLKELCVELEDEDALGRLFDLDVIAPDGEKLDRAALGRGERPCLICGAAGRGCASRRVHPVAELQARTRAILRDHFARFDAERIAAQAVRALTYEVCATPKPGLVDRANRGSHRDMDIFTFLDSVAALVPYLREAVEIGQSTAALPPEEAFARLRRAGLRTERDMRNATGGVNTHKGAIFSLGTVCAAAGRLWLEEKPWAGAEAVLAECARMYAGVAAEDFAAARTEGARTAGERLYLAGGMRGIRGELADGLPSVAHVGLPALREALERGETLERAGLWALLRLIAEVGDTNLCARGGEAGRDWAAGRAEALTARGRLPGRAELDALDAAFIERNLSPGGCADLLAISYFLHFCESGAL